MRKPNFFILGAPKCGTTALAQALGTHPQVFFSRQKEPHFFNTDMAHRFFTERDHYETLFDEAGPEHRAVGEGSVWYLYSRDAVTEIEAYADEAPRYIVCVRNPVDMAYSLHEELIFSGNETEGDFETAWRLSEKRRRGVAVPRQSTDDGKMVIFPLVCALGTQLARLYETVPKERVHVVVLDDLRTHGGQVLDGVQDFLGLDRMPGLALSEVNGAKQRRSRHLQQALRKVHGFKRALHIRRSMGLIQSINLWNRRGYVRPPMSDDLRIELTAHFAPEVNLLATLLNRDFSHWQAPIGAPAVA